MPCTCSLPAKPLHLLWPSPPAVHTAPHTPQDVLLEETEGPSKTIVLITDGKPTDQPDALEAAAEARKRGIKMVTVGAGDIDYGAWRCGVGAHTNQCCGLWVACSCMAAAGLPAPCPQALPVFSQQPLPHFNPPPCRHPEAAVLGPVVCLCQLPAGCLGPAQGGGPGLPGRLPRTGLREHTL